MRKIFGLVSLVMLVMVFAFAGCAQAEPAAPVPAAPDASAVPPEPAPVDEPADPAQPADEQPEGGLLIAYSQMDTDTMWRIMQIENLREAVESRGHRFIYTNADNDTARQISDIEDLIAMRPDYLLISPREYEALGISLQSARDAGIPVILVDRAAAGEPGLDFLAVTHADFIWEGQQSALVLAEYFDGREANIVQLTGTPGSSVAVERQQGFEDELANHPNLRIIATQVGDFSRAVAQTTMENLLLAHGNDIDAVYGHSDEEGLGAILAIRAFGLVPGEDIVIVSINGFYDSLRAILDGSKLATVECSPFFGEIVMDIIERHQRGEQVPDFVVNPGRVYDITNAQYYIDAGHGF